MEFDRNYFLPVDFLRSFSEGLKGEQKGGIFVLYYVTLYYWPNAYIISDFFSPNI